MTKPNYSVWSIVVPSIFVIHLINDEQFLITALVLSFTYYNSDISPYWKVDIIVISKIRL